MEFIDGVEEGDWAVVVRIFGVSFFEQGGDVGISKLGVYGGRVEPVIDVAREDGDSGRRQFSAIRFRWCPDPRPCVT